MPLLYVTKKARGGITHWEQDVKFVGRDRIGQNPSPPGIVYSRTLQLDAQNLKRTVLFNAALKVCHRSTFGFERAGHRVSSRSE